MKMTDRDMDEIDTLLAQARRTQAPVDDALMARVLADAARLQPEAQQMPRQSGWRSWVRDLIGGWPAMGGVVAAGLTGVWVGVAPPAGIEEFTATFLGTSQTVAFLPETDLTLFEEPIDG